MYSTIPITAIKTENTLKFIFKPDVRLHDQNGCNINGNDLQFRNCDSNSNR